MKITIGKKFKIGENSEAKEQIVIQERAKFLGEELKSIEEIKEKRRRKGSTSIDNSKLNNENSRISIYLKNLLANKNKLSKGYYILLFAMIILGGGSVYLASKTYMLFNKEEYSVYSSVDTIDSYSLNSDGEEVISALSKIEEQSESTNNLDTIEEFKEEEKNNTANTTVQNVNKVVTIKPLSFIKPVEGEIQKIYSSDKVIYSKTLDLWKTHDGIDIGVDIGTYIKSIEKGTVEKVYDDSFYGVTIVIDHGQGYKSSYSNLDNSTLVKEGETVIKGQKIGKVGNTSIGEIKDEAHIHFMLYKDGNVADPTYIFK